MNALLFPSMTSAALGSVGSLCNKNCQVPNSSHVLVFTLDGLLEFTGGHFISSVTIMPYTFKQLSPGQNRKDLWKVFILCQKRHSARLARSLSDQYNTYSLDDSRNQFCCMLVRQSLKTRHIPSPREVYLGDS